MNICLRWIFAAVLATFLLGVPEPASAASAAQYRAYGNQLYKQRQYAKALQYYEASYKLQPDPKLKNFIDRLRAHVQGNAGKAAAPGAATANQASGTGSATAASTAAAKKWRFGGNLVGRYALMGLDDLKDDADYSQAGWDAGTHGPSDTFSAEVGTSGLGFGAMVTVFSPMNLGLGIGFVRESVSGLERTRHTEISTPNPFPPPSTWDLVSDSSTKVEYKHNLIPISVLYRHQFNPKFFIDGNLGIDIASSTVNWESSTKETGSLAGADWSGTAEFSGGGTGFHIGASGGYLITNNIGVYLGLQYLMLNAKGFEGTFTTVSGGGSPNTSDPRKAIMVEDASGSVTGRYLSSVDVSDPLDADETEFEANAGGLRIEFGVSILFP